MSVICLFFGKMIKKYIHSYPDRVITLCLNLSEESLGIWKKLLNVIEYTENVNIVLNILPDLPSKDILIEWSSHNLRAIQINTSIFVSNKNGYPVLSK